MSECGNCTCCTAPKVFGLCLDCMSHPWDVDCRSDPCPDLIEKESPE